MPPGAPTDFYARLVALRSAGRRIAVDTSGDALRACARSGVDLLKPNLSELEDLAGHGLSTIGDAVAAARDVMEGGTRSLLVSLGQDGAVFVNRETAAHAEASIVDAVNAVGAGDALLAGFLACGGGPSALAEAIAWSVAAVRSDGTQMRTVTDADRAAVVLHSELDVDRALHRS